MEYYMNRCWLNNVCVSRLNILVGMVTKGKCQTRKSNDAKLGSRTAPNSEIILKYSR